MATLGANLGAGPVGPIRTAARTRSFADLTITITEASLDGLRRAVANYRSEGWTATNVTSLHPAGAGRLSLCVAR
jgi:hypothetical protein